MIYGLLLAVTGSAARPGRFGVGGSGRIMGTNWGPKECALVEREEAGGRGGASFSSIPRHNLLSLSGATTGANAHKYILIY